MHRASPHKKSGARSQKVTPMPKRCQGDNEQIMELSVIRCPLSERKAPEFLLLLQQTTHNGQHTSFHICRLPSAVYRPSLFTLFQVLGWLEISPYSPWLFFIHHWESQRSRFCSTNPSSVSSGYSRITRSISFRWALERHSSGFRVQVPHISPWRRSTS